MLHEALSDVLSNEYYLCDKFAVLLWGLNQRGHINELHAAKHDIIIRYSHARLQPVLLSMWLQSCTLGDDLCLNTRDRLSKWPSDVSQSQNEVNSTVQWPHSLHGLATEVVTLSLSMSTSALWLTFITASRKASKMWKTNAASYSNSDWFRSHSNICKSIPRYQLRYRIQNTTTDIELYRTTYNAIIYALKINQYFRLITQLLPIWINTMVLVFS